MSQDANKTEPTAAELLATDELIDELRRRCHMIVLGYVTLADPSGWHTRIGGPKIGVRGMAAELMDEARRFGRES